MGCSQKEFASRVEISPVSVSRYLGGERQPGADELYRMAIFFGVSMEWLFVGKDHVATSEWQRRALRAEKKLEKMQKGMQHLGDTVSNLTEILASEIEEELENRSI